MPNSQALFHCDSITIGGKSFSVEDNTVMVNGIAGYNNGVVPSASGPDCTKRTREPRTITFKLQFTSAVSVDDIRNIRAEQVVIRDLEAPRRIMSPNTCFGSMGAVGSGTVDVTLNALEDYVWL